MYITFNNVSSKTMGVTVHSVNNPVPAVKSMYYNPTWRNGSIDLTNALYGDDFYENKVVDVQIQFKANSVAQLRAKAREVANWLSGTGNLYVDTTLYYYRARVINSIDYVPKMFGRYAEMNVSFVCEPFAYSQQLITQNITGTTWNYEMNGPYTITDFKFKYIQTNIREFFVTVNQNTITYNDEHGAFSYIQVDETNKAVYWGDNYDLYGKYTITNNGFYTPIKEDITATFTEGDWKITYRECYLI